MIPYVVVPAIVPQVLWITGILVAHGLWMRRVRTLGMDEGTAAGMSLAMVISGIIGGRLFRLVYAPEEVWSGGLASFGGIAGGLIAAAVHIQRQRKGWTDGVRYLDALAAVFPLGWIVGRMGCSLAHDHPGARSTSWLAVGYPGGSRFNLGVVEVVFLGLVMIPVWGLLARRVWPPGFLLGLTLAVYGAFRLALDALHADPPRYLEVTVDQWAYGTALFCGLAILGRVFRRRGVDFGGRGKRVALAPRPENR